MTKRKPRSDSAASAIDAMVNASKPLPDIPAHVRLDKRHLPFWDGIIRARARSEWIETDLVVAAQLARTQYDIEKESETLESEGSVIENARGTPVMNPRHAVLEQLARREMALMRALRITGAAAGIDPRDLAKQRNLERQSRDTKDELLEDDLLAS
jgi:hypothetical protein